MKVENILVILNAKCQEAFNLFTQNEEIRNEFFLLQKDAKSAHKINKMSDLFTQISERLEFYSSYSHPFPDELFSQFLIYHKQVDEVLPSKEISINNQIDYELNTNEIINNIEDTIQLQQADENESYESVNLPNKIWVKIILNEATFTNFIQKIAEEHRTSRDKQDYTFQKLILRFAQEELYKLNATCKVFHGITQPFLNELKPLFNVYTDEEPSDPYEILNKVEGRTTLTCDDRTTQNISSVIKKFLEQIAYFIPIRNFDFMINKAVRNNNAALVSCFIAAGKNRKYYIPMKSRRIYDKDNLYINALHVAVSHDNENMVRLLLAWTDAQGDLVIDPRVDFCDTRDLFIDEKDSFDLALTNGNVPILRLLLDLRDAQGTQLIKPNNYPIAQLLSNTAAHEARELFDNYPRIRVLLKIATQELAELLREYGVREYGVAE